MMPQLALLSFFICFRLESKGSAFKTATNKKCPPPRRWGIINLVTPRGLNSNQMLIDLHKINELGRVCK
jgi:hypothetical protein